MLLIDTERVQHPTLTLTNSQNIVLAFAQGCEQPRNIHLAVDTTHCARIIQHTRDEVVNERLNLFTAISTAERNHRLILEEGRGTHADFNPSQACSQTLAYSMGEGVFGLCRSHDSCDSRANWV